MDFVTCPGTIQEAMRKDKLRGWPLAKLAGRHIAMAKVTAATEQTMGRVPRA
jgi:hypothetical protein